MEIFEHMDGATLTILIGLIIKLVVQAIKSIPPVDAWLESKSYSAQKAAKLLTVFVMALLSVVPTYLADANLGQALGVLISRTAHAVLIHEGWDKLVVGWLKGR